MNQHEEAKKTVLMICYYYPPLRTSGTTRSVEFTRHLPSFGWQPLVLTVKKARDRWLTIGDKVPEGVAVERSYELDVFGLVSLLHGICCRVWGLFGKELRTNWFYRTFCIPDPQIGWLTTIKGISIAKRADCIYATCSPFSSAISACLIKLFSNKPCVLDFRDAWSLNPHFRYGGIRGWIEKRLETFVIKIADQVILNTKGTKSLYERNYPEYAKKFTYIPNGFDKLLHIPTENKQLDEYVIMHLGGFYTTRSPDLLLEALEELNDSQIVFVQVGPKFDSYERFKNRLPLRLIESMPREEALKLMCSASLLYLKQGWEEGVTEYIPVAAKTYEYLSTGLPILAECPPGDNIDILREFANSSYLITSKNKDEIKQAVLKAKEQWPQYVPRVSDEFIKTFDRKKLSEKLATIFDQVYKHKSSF